MLRSGSLGAPRASLSALALALVLAVGPIGMTGVATAATKHPNPTASRPFTYDTSGVVDIGADPASVTGTAVLQFQGVDGIWFHPKSGQTLGLGQFAAVPSTLTPGQATTYTDTPFEVQVRAPEFDKTNTVPLLDKVFPKFGRQLSLKTEIENSLLLKGHLDGTVSANGQVAVVATIDSIKLGGTAPKTSDHATRYAFPIRFSQVILPPGWRYSTTGSLTLPTSSTMTPLASTVAEAQLIAPSATNLPGMPTTAPEPSTIVVFVVAIGALAASRRRVSAR